MIGKRELRTFLNIFLDSLGSLRSIDEHIDWKITGRWMILSVTVGLMGGVGALVFNFLTHFLQDLLLENLIGYPNPTPYSILGKDFKEYLHLTRPYLVFFIPAIGGLVVGWLVYRFAPEAEGHGTDGVIKSFHEKRGKIPIQVAIVKTVASAITLGSGGSAGKEGPIAQIGASLASFLAQRFRLSMKERRFLLLAGMAAGIGSIFQAPLAGAFFAVEVLYREDVESDALMPAVVASITGYAFYSTIVGTSTVFPVPSFNRFFNLYELAIIPFFALFLSIIAIFYVQIFYGFHDRFFKSLTIHPMFRPALGGLMTGAIALFFPAVLGSSYGWLEMGVKGMLPIHVMFLLMVLKILATSFSIGSGGSGGVFAPSLVIGGMAGGAVGYALKELNPEIFNQPSAFILVGMGTLFAAVSHTPLASTIMISELTGSYRLLVPLILGCTISHLISLKWTLYRSQYPNHASSPANRPELIPNILSQVKVKDVMHFVSKSVPVIEMNEKFESLLRLFANMKEEIILVKNQKGEFVGIIALEHLQNYLAKNEMEQKQISVERLVHPFYFLRPNDTLDIALSIFQKTGYPELPVLDQQFHLLGFLHVEEALKAYHEAFLRLRQGSTLSQKT